MSKEVPDMLSPEWNDYAMSHFASDELVSGDDGEKQYPTTAGLRRVAEKLIGPIIKSSPSQVFPVEGNQLGRATVVYEVVFDVDGTHKLYADVADVWHGNTDDLFLVHAIATASTRAEGRALRKALKLRTLAAEELCKKNVSKEVAKEKTVERITDHQITYIERKCKAIDIDVMKFINLDDGNNNLTKGKSYDNIHKVTKQEAIEIIQKLKNFVNDKNLVNNYDLGVFDAAWSET